MSKPRMLTTDEVRERFLDHVRTLAAYWNDVPNQTTRDKLDGLAFSIMVLLDGGTGLPGFKVTPNPHAADKEYHRREGSNWFPNDCDIAGCLHDMYHKKG